MKKIILSILAIILLTVTGLLIVNKTDTPALNTSPAAPPNQNAEFETPRTKVKIYNETENIKKYGEIVKVENNSVCKQEVFKSALVSYLDKRVTMLSGFHQCLSKKLFSDSQRLEAEGILNASAQRAKKANWSGKEIELSEENLKKLSQE